MRYNAVDGWFLETPLPQQYQPLSKIAFGAPELVLPHQLPPSAMIFPTPWANQMLNIPGIATLYSAPRGEYTQGGAGRF